MNMDKTILEMLTSNRDEAITKYKENHDDDDLKILYTEEYK